MGNNSSLFKKISKQRKKELINYIISNKTINEKYQENNQKIQNKNLFFPFILKFENNDFINSHFILISNDIILIPTKHAFKNNSQTPNSLFFPQIKKDIIYDTDNLIIENDNYNNIYTIIKIFDKSFLFEKYFNIPDDSNDFKLNEKFFINEKDEEESLEINNSNKKIISTKKDSLLTPIYIKRNDQLFLIGLINENKKFYIFNKNELLNIKNIIENIEMKFHLSQIKILDFSNIKINEIEMNFFFQYCKNLKYLNLENINLTNQGLKALQNENLKNLKYLNLSNNNITNVGLTYLDYFSNLTELVLFNMNNLSEDYFLFLQENTNFYKINILRCDKQKLFLKFVHPNYNNFVLPNLTFLKIIENSIKIHLILKELFQLDKICSQIKELDLSNTGMTDNGMLRLTKNISVFKNIELINIENTKITTYSNKYFEQIQKQNIKIIDFTCLKPKFQKKGYHIILGGSTTAGKTCYINSYITKSFKRMYLSNISLESHIIRNQEYKKTFIVCDSVRWSGIFTTIVQNFIMRSDGVILLFDISDKRDFDDLPYCIRMITNYFELEEFPVLLIGNKVDLEKKVDQNDIERLLKTYNFINYFEVSSKTLLNVEESLNFIMNYICEKEKLFPMLDTNLKKEKKQ